MDATRHLLVIADDFGIGPETSRGILDLAARGLVTGTVLLVNSPHAQRAVADWRRAGEPVELGWHPCLTLDRPVLPIVSASSLVDFDGRFWSLAAFVRRLYQGRIRTAEVRRELLAQYRRFVDLVGRPPSFVNSHQHVTLFAPVGDVLMEVLTNSPRPVYVRRVREPWQLLTSIPGARPKRLALNFLGRRQAKRFAQAGFPGAEWLVGLSDRREAARLDYFTRWIARASGRDIELLCHPGHLDPTLGGRDGTPTGSAQLWRIEEYRRLSESAFAEACEQAGFCRVRPTEWLDRRGRELTHAA